MYWSPIRTRLLVGMLTPAIRAKAATPLAGSVADFRDCRLRVAPSLHPPHREGCRKGVPVGSLWHLPQPSPRAVKAGAGRIQDDFQPRISTNATLPSNQGLASLANSWTGCAVFTVSITIRQPLRPGFFGPGPVFPPVGRLGLVGAVPPLLTTTFMPALALFLSRLAPSGAACALAGLVCGLASGFTSDLGSSLPFASPRAAAEGFALPARPARSRLTVAGRLRALRRCAALRAAAVRGASGRRRAGIAAVPSDASSKAAATAAVTSSIDAMPSTVWRRSRKSPPL